MLVVRYNQLDQVRIARAGSTIFKVVYWLMFLLAIFLIPRTVVVVVVVLVHGIIGIASRNINKL